MARPNTSSKSLMTLPKFSSILEKKKKLMIILFKINKKEANLKAENLNYV